MKIILLGYMGSGKTGVGNLLAQKLNLPFFDLDEQIVLSENRSVPEIFKTSGEIYFRKKEKEVMIALIRNSKPNFVLALGGGTPCYGENLQVLKKSPGVKTIYLKTSLEELKKRLFRERFSRPLISHLNSEEVLEDFIRKHLFERSFYYSQSDLTVETNRKTLEAISEEILEKLK